MTSSDLERLQQRIAEAGLEIYRVEGDTILLAERVRMHLMEAGVQVTPVPSLRIRMKVRAQRSDFPTDGAEAMFDRVRRLAGPAAQGQGFVEAAAEVREVRNPSHDDQLLDVWYEVAFEKQVDAAQLADDLRWAMAQPRYLVGQ